MRGQRKALPCPYLWARVSQTHPDPGTLRSGQGIASSEVAKLCSDHKTTSLFLGSVRDGSGGREGGRPGLYIGGVGFPRRSTYYHFPVIAWGGHSGASEVSSSPEPKQKSSVWPGGHPPRSQGLASLDHSPKRNAFGVYWLPGGD